MHIAAYIYGAVFAAIVGVLTSLMLEERLANILVGVGGGISNRRGRDIRGCWYSIYWYQGVDGKIGSIRTLVRARQLRKRVVCVAGNGHSVFHMSGSLDQDTYFTGTWENCVQGSIYKGSCQLVVEPEGDALVGRWVGWNKRHVVGSGAWVLVRLRSECSSKEFMEMVDRFQANEATFLSGFGSAVQLIRELASRQVPGSDATWRDALRNLDGRVA